MECRQSQDCESAKVCQEGSCVNLCQLPNACGAKAQCGVVNHVKKCSCPLNFIGNPNIECKPDKNDCLSSPSGANAICQNLVGSYSCQCAPGCTGDGYSGCLCSQPQTGCTPATCGLGALCTVDLIGPICKCPNDKPNGDPLVECLSDNGKLIFSLLFYSLLTLFDVNMFV